MFLFPWFDYGIDISTFEKSHFFADQAILGYFHYFPKSFSAETTLACIGQKISILAEKSIFLKFERKTSKLSGNVFWTSGDHLGPQKSKFFQKKDLKSPKNA